MNLKEVYEIFYPGKEQNSPSVWTKPPKHRTKKEFFETVFPMELRWLNTKLWNDKARRSRFFADSRAEQKYTAALKAFILQNPMVISRMEYKCEGMLGQGISAQAMNRVFFQIADEEQIYFSAMLQKYLMNREEEWLKGEWGKVLTFFILYAIFPEEVNQLYTGYLYGKEHDPFEFDEKKKRDLSLFQYEYPPDMSVHKPGDWITHTWVLKNVGEIPWEKRRFECLEPPFSLKEEARKIFLPDVVYPGDTVSLTVHFQVPDTPGAYHITWKMRDCEDNLSFPQRVGLGLHFTILEKQQGNRVNAENNYRILEEKPPIPATVVAGNLYAHSWKMENTGTVTWRDYYCECINGESFGYARNELRIAMKQKVEPGEQIQVQVEFATPPIEGVYRLIWQIMKRNGKPAFAEGRQLEILLNLI